MRRTHLEILDEVVEHPQSVRVLGILDVAEGTDFRGLRGEVR